jgi:hypothetical protein
MLTAVQKFTSRVQVTGVDGCFDQDMHHDGAQVREIQPGVMPPRFRLRRWVAESPGGDDLVGVGDGGAVCSKHVRHRLVGTHLPVTVVTFGPEVQRLAGHHDFKPVSLVGQGEVPHEPEARPSGWQHGLTKLLVGQPLELSEYVVPLTVEAVKQQITLRSCMDVHTNTLGALRSENPLSLGAERCRRHREDRRSAGPQPGAVFAHGGAALES